MGAAATIELQKPVDASDIISAGSVELAKAEVIRLRTSLGHLAKDSDFNNVLNLDGSDLIKGNEGDFDRCVDEISHIRKALQLSTQSSRRKTRHVGNEFSTSDGTVDKVTLIEGDDNSDDDSTCSDS